MKKNKLVEEYRRLTKQCKISEIELVLARRGMDEITAKRLSREIYSIIFSMNGQK